MINFDSTKAVTDSQAAKHQMANDAVNVAQLPEFDEFVDVRSPSEYSLDHIPGAINCPVLDDTERATVGTLYANESAFAAKRVGAALVARNIARHLETAFAEKPKTWRPLVYCWRGGQRSAAMTVVLRQIGWDARQLIGGYKAYRRKIVADIERLAPAMRFEVVCGLTGSGKSALLAELESQRAQVLDLERLAEHRGSVLGTLPGCEQPGQKMFESRVWQRLSAFDPKRPVYVEGESRRIGNLRVPEPLIEVMRASPCIELRTDTAARVELLLREYAHLTEDRDELYRRLDCLTPLHGHQRVGQWKTLAAAGQWQTFVSELLQQHYDPAYRKSAASNYGRLSQATRLTLDSVTPDAFAELAKRLLELPARSSHDRAAHAGAAAA